MYSDRKEEMTVDRAVSPCVVLHKLFQGDYTLLLNASLSVIRSLVIVWNI